jgi:hypothetical protein
VDNGVASHSLFAASAQIFRLRRQDCIPGVPRGRHAASLKKRDVIRVQCEEASVHNAEAMFSKCRLL